ncbi:MAG: DUF1217 domain-containing protein, partial [Halocynthiibacter sp.]
ALGAFDLSEDINNRFFIGRILEEGPTDPGALANLLQDSRYKNLAEKFAPGNFLLGVTKIDAFSDDIENRYKTIAFEKAVGEQSADLRLALGFSRTLPEVIDASSNDVAWFNVMANAPVKEVFQTVFGLPSQFSLLDIDHQHDVLKEKASQVLGTDDLTALAEPDKAEEIIRSFLLKRQIAGVSVASPMQTALSLVSAIPRASVFDAALA